MSDKKKQKTVTLSFREDEEWIYREICKHSSKGGWIKDILADHLRGSKREHTNAEEKTEKSINNFLDF